jgi:hypothetical protein
VLWLSIDLCACSKASLLTRALYNNRSKLLQVIKILLQHYPEAACTPQGESGKLPLILAIESKRRSWEDGIRTLLYAYPPALHNKKVIEPVWYPNVLALVSNDGDVDAFLPSSIQRPAYRSKQIRRETNSRTILYELIRSKPEWLTPDGRQGN